MCVYIMWSCFNEFIDYMNWIYNWSCSRPRQWKAHPVTAGRVLGQIAGRSLLLLLSLLLLVLSWLQGSGCASCLLGHGSSFFHQCYMRILQISVHTHILVFQYPSIWVLHILAYHMLILLMPCAVRQANRPNLGQGDDQAQSGAWVSRASNLPGLFPHRARIHPAWTK